MFLLRAFSFLILKFIDFIKEFSVKEKLEIVSGEAPPHFRIFSEKCV
jgi:hypothetical protein